MIDPYSFYTGFTIDKAVGNNLFSYQDRKNKSITIPALIKGTPNNLQVSEYISFSEIVDSVEYNLCGLKNFIHWEYNGKECFIFDNHNHAFFFWVYALQKKLFEWGMPLVHVDQHTDMRKPERFITKEDFNNPLRVFEYANFELNVGNFIQPALNLGLFKEMDVIDSSYTFDSVYEPPFVLDIDMDIFGIDMNYIPDDLKIKKIREFAQHAKFITIATSPFFIDQNVVIKKIKEIFLSDH